MTSLRIRKFLLSITLAVVVLLPLFFVSSSYALTIPDINIQQTSYTQPTDYAEISHEYGLYLQPNGEAFVVLKAVINNHYNHPISEFHLQLPSNTISDLSVIQVRRTPGDYSNSLDETYYRKARYRVQGHDLTVQLPDPISNIGEGSGCFLVYFRSTAYTKKTLLGGYTYSFETLKIPTPLFDLRVGVHVNKGLFLRHGEYGNTYPSFPITSIPSISDKEILANRQVNQDFNEFFNDLSRGAIEQVAQSTEEQTRTGFGPGKTEVVQGEYADALWKFYLLYFLIAIIAILLVSIFLFIFIKRHKKVAQIPVPSDPNPIPTIPLPIPLSSMNDKEHVATLYHTRNILFIAFGLLIFLLVSALVFLFQKPIPLEQNFFVSNIFTPLVFIDMMLISIGCVRLFSVLPERRHFLSGRFLMWLQNIYAFRLSSLLLMLWILSLFVPLIFVYQIDPGYGTSCFTPFSFLVHTLSHDHYIFPSYAHLGISFPCSFNDSTGYITSTGIIFLQTLTQQAAMCFSIVLLLYVISNFIIRMIHLSMKKIMSKSIISK